MYTVSLKTCHSTFVHNFDKYWLFLNKNLAIAKRSLVSCAHNMMRASMGLTITPWPWNLG